MLCIHGDLIFNRKIKPLQKTILMIATTYELRYAHMIYPINGENYRHARSYDKTLPSILRRQPGQPGQPKKLRQREPSTTS